MGLSDFLACPLCKVAVVRSDAATLRCTACARGYPIVDGVPVMLADPAAAMVQHEGDLGVQHGYSAWKDRALLRSLTPAQIALDFGAGRQALDDPCIIRMDVTLNRWVDVVGDVQALPFLPGSVDYAFSGAVMEHVANPARAVDELWAVLKPGGYVYADWNFIVAYHGYPHHYFNATLHGLREAFARFEILDTGIAPYHGASFALTSYISTYLRHFRPQTRLEHDFAQHLTKVLWYPIEAYDARIDPADRFRVAASGYVLGMKRPTGVEHLIPAPLLRVHEESPALQRRFPRPWDLSSSDNLLWWAQTEGVRTVPAVRDYFAALTPFSKYDDGRAFARPVVHAWTTELLSGPVDLGSARERAERLWASHSLWLRLREARAQGGAAAMIGAILLSLRQWRQAAGQLLRAVFARGR